MSNKVFINESQLHSSDKSVQLETVQIKGEIFYKIENVDQMDPFFMTIVSSSDHWMFISSNGGLSAGRKDAENALFPYYSDDKITASSEKTGSKTLIKVHQESKTLLWEPFSIRGRDIYQISQNLYKNRLGSAIIFEEINHDLSISFRYRWQFSEVFGFVKDSEIINLSSKTAEVEILDGIQNVLPYGVSTQMQNVRSNLVDGYKRNILDGKHRIGAFTLSAMIVDRAEPSEALKATLVWSKGIEADHVLLSDNQLQGFRFNKPLSEETDVKGRSGSYFIHSKFSLTANQSTKWYIVADINKDRADLSNLKLKLDSENILNELLQDISNTKLALEKLVGKADGLQLTKDHMSTGRHVSNVLFNIMRGGIFEENYSVELRDFLDYLKDINLDVWKKYHTTFGSGEELSYQDLIIKSRESKDENLMRICMEYLPLTFSRRHGDPSRPWNRFNIDLKNSDGSKKRSYEGNWRDIFQNWEALAYSFPEFATGMVFKFLNASTIDGYNPYRITREGIDWEVIEPDDPWSYIGYWGDHQIIYLQKLLECALEHDSNFLDRWINEKVFVYANVPYDIASYDQILEDPQDTIAFNHEKEALIEEQVSRIGADGKFVIVGSDLLKASMMEKLLVTLLAKLSNFVPEGGIWLNTQRPEWNDANNALVGNGLSMVTLYYMRRFCQFLLEKVNGGSASDFDVHEEVKILFMEVKSTLEVHQKQLEGSFSDEDRKKFVDAMGRAGENYRNKANGGFSRKSEKIIKEDLSSLLAITLKYIDHSIRCNRREDNLFHAYNLLEFSGEELKINRLYEMLEGQVAVLSAGILDGKQSLAVLDALKASKMYREDQYSYFLYPNRDIPHFLDKNQIPDSFASKSKLLKALKDAGNRELVTFDDEGRCFFSGDIHNANDIKGRLAKMSGLDSLISSEGQQVLDVFEEMFDHKSFTGRSGTFFAFEGLGSIYWHMVSKLLLATQETIYRCLDDLSDDEKGRLIQHYYEIRAGIGINKNPDLYGAFPTDPYSHTPFHKGAQQPGMTGQVKEDVLNRWAELGVRVKDGIISFKPEFLNPDEFLTESAEFRYFDLDDKEQTLLLEAGQLAFTYCQVPVIYQKSGEVGIRVEGESSTSRADFSLTLEESKSLFQRTGEVQVIRVGVS